MAKAILGKKGRMSQMFTEEGTCVPVTILEAGPCHVTKILSSDADGYDAVQLGYETVREKVLSKAEVGHCKKANIAPQRFLREFRLDAPADYELGAEVNVEAFEVGDKIDVAGTSKGRGFAGVMKRHGFKGGRMTHGGMARRRPGSIGMSAYPGKTIKGKRMSGHMGDERVTAKNVEIVQIDKERNFIVVKGAVPGHRGTLLVIRSAKVPAKKEAR